MKNNLKFTLGLAFVSLLGIGCKKNLEEPLPKQSTEQNGIRLQAAVKVRAVGFQAEQDDAGDLLLENIPVNTKQFIVITDGTNVRTQTTKTLCAAAASGNSKQITNEAVKNTMTVRQAASFKSCKTEVFALDRELLPKEMDQLKTMTRETFRTYCQDPNTKMTLLGSTVVTDAIKALEISKKRIELARERARTAKQKAEERFAAGNATRKSLNSAEDNLASLDSKLEYLKKKLSDHQVH